MCYIKLYFVTNTKTYRGKVVSTIFKLGYNPDVSEKLPKKRWNGVSPKKPLKLKCRWPLTPFLL